MTRVGWAAPESCWQAPAHSHIDWLAVHTVDFTTRKPGWDPRDGVEAHLPQLAWHPAPQWAVVMPQKLYWEQHWLPGQRIFALLPQGPPGAAVGGGGRLVAKLAATLVGLLLPVTLLPLVLKFWAVAAAEVGTRAQRSSARAQATSSGASGLASRAIAIAIPGLANFKQRFANLQ